jgi:hypothetical protein
MFDVTCQSRFYVGFDVHFMCILCALDVPLLFNAIDTTGEHRLLFDWAWNLRLKPESQY